MLLAISAFRESGPDLIEIEAWVIEKLEKRFPKKKLQFYHFYVYPNNYFTFNTRGKKKKKKKKKTLRDHESPSILTNKIPSVLF